MRRRPGIGSAKFSVPILLMILVVPAFGISCLTQSQMSAAQREGLRQTAMTLAQDVQEGNTAAVQRLTIAAVASQFGPISSSIQGVSSSIQHATLTVDQLYLLDATDLKSAQDTQFFCGLALSTLTVVISIPNLPPGEYALAVTHATGVKNPHALTTVLENEGGSSGAPAWKLAGFFTRPMTMGGQDGVWFWKQARDYAAKQQNWNAYFYYQTAEFLLAPVDFLTSPNLQKLQREAQKVKPGGLPGTEPMSLAYNGQTYNVTNLHTGELAGQLDLIVSYQGTPNQDPVAARAQVTAVMRGLLQQHPELRSAFHGLWVYARTPGNQSPFALELPMDQIENSAPHSGE